MDAFPDNLSKLEVLGSSAQDFSLQDSSRKIKERYFGFSYQSTELQNFKNLVQVLKDVAMQSFKKFFSKTNEVKVLDVKMEFIVKDKYKENREDKSHTQRIMNKINTVG